MLTMLALCLMVPFCTLDSAKIIAMNLQIVHFNVSVHVGNQRLAIPGQILTRGVKSVILWNLLTVSKEMMEVSF